MSTFAHFILLIVAQWLASAINKTVAKVSNVFQKSAQDWLKKCYNNLNLINNVYLCNKSEWNDDYSNRGTPLPIPNREDKPICANGTVIKIRESRRLSLSERTSNPSEGLSGGLWIQKERKLWCRRISHCSRLNWGFSLLWRKHYTCWFS